MKCDIVVVHKFVMSLRKNRQKRAPISSTQILQAHEVSHDMEILRTHLHKYLQAYSKHNGTSLPIWKFVSSESHGQMKFSTFTGFVDHSSFHGLQATGCNVHDSHKRSSPVENHRKTTKPTTN